MPAKKTETPKKKVSLEIIAPSSTIETTYVIASSGKRVCDACAPNERRPLVLVAAGSVAGDECAHAGHPKEQVDSE